MNIHGKYTLSNDSVQLGNKSTHKNLCKKIKLDVINTVCPKL